MKAYKKTNQWYTLFKVIFAAAFIVWLAQQRSCYALETERSLWITWESHDPNSQININHALFQKFIQKYLSTPHEGLALFNYAKVTPKDQTLLTTYLKQLEKINVDRLNRNEQLAYWLNLYNALVIKLVIDHYPIESVQDINLGRSLFHIGPWHTPLIKIQGFDISLDDIRNRIIRPIWNDPRTLYALCNATIGAPNLHYSVFEGKKLDRQLNEVAHNYINSPRAAQIIQQRLIVSKLYDWYEEDFGGTKQDVISHLKLFAQPELKRQLNHIPTIHGYAYNWHLNIAITD